MRTHRCLQLSTLAVLAVACSGQEPPANPFWDLDVYPILRGSCSHCHGMTVAPPSTPLSRLDVCDAEAFSAQGLTVPIGAKTSAAVILAEITSMGGQRPLMPPPPAGVLSDYQYKVLQKWSMRPSCTKQVQNRKPAVRIVQPAARSGNKVTVTIEVTDPDGDQVLGKAKLGTGADTADNPFVIKGAGRWAIEFANGNPADPLAITLFDGYDKYP
jgi:hypothetical protein